MRKIPDHLKPAFYNFLAEVVEECPKWRRWTDEDIEALVVMRDEGKNWKEIADTLDRTPMAVRRMYYISRGGTVYERRRMETPA